MRRVLLVHPWVRPQGGGQTVAAWTLQALRDCCDLTLVTWDPVDYQGVNATFGTSLRAGDFRVHRPSPAVRTAVACLPGNENLLITSLLLREARRLLRVQHHDVVLGTHDEMDFGRRGIQYVHYPHGYARPSVRRYRWFQKPPGLVALYRGLCNRISPATMAGVCRNVTLVNSRFVQERVVDLYGLRSAVVHPPVPGGFPDVPWDARDHGFVCMGRLAPVKQLVDAIAIIAAVRARGHDVRLRVIGTREDPRYEARIRDLVRTHSTWLSLHVALPRTEMVALVARHRYALHAQAGEPFGIAVAEFVRAGCVTFVARPGGPVEIVGDEPALTFATRAEAVDRIDAALRDAGRLDRLRAHLRSRRDLFSAEHFMREMQRVVADFGSDPGA